MKVVVIGGSGFVGSHTADELSSKGHEVTIFDQVKSPWLRQDQKMVIGDILDKAFVSEVIKGADCVYHFAGIADINSAGDKILDTIQSNIMGTTIVVDACVNARVKRLVYASTLYVYSAHGGFYRISKQAAEDIIQMYSEKFGLGYTILRYGSLYGSRSQSWNGLRSFVEQAIKSGKIHYRGTGQEIREYIHVKDAARLSVRALDDDYRNSCLTLTGTQVLHSSEMLKIIEEIIGRPIEVIFQTDDPNRNHYVRTPYRYTPKPARKLVSNEFIDIGQGILELVEEIHLETEN